MEGHTFLSWNIPNLVSIWLMILLGVVLLKVVSKVFQMRGANDNATTQSTATAAYGGLSMAA